MITRLVKESEVKMLANIEIRQAIDKKRIKHYELARALNVSACTLSRWLALEMTPEKKQEVLDAINKIEF